MAASPRPSPAGWAISVPPASPGWVLGLHPTTSIIADFIPEATWAAADMHPTRARELASEGSTRSMWGPPVASGLSTPLRETIPESPGDDGDTFPDLGSANESGIPTRSASLRRSRAGTLPSQFPGIGGSATPASLSTRATPSTSPFRTPANSISAGAGLGRSASSSSTAGRSAFLLSRIRAGSTPQRSGLGQSQTSSPFASSLFSSSWNAGRDRASTHSGAQSKDSDDFIKDLADTDVKTLDYLGLADRSPKPLDDLDVNRYLADIQRQQQFANFQPFDRNVNRYRSFSVNATAKYDHEEEDYSMYSGQLTPSAVQASLAATQAQIHQHNLEVQAFVNRNSGSRPRARTAGVLDSPAARMWNSGHDTFSSGVGGFADGHDLQGLTDSVQAMQLQSGPGRQQDTVSEDASRALWLGNIPSSTTTSSLKVIFEPFGKIESVRVLTHKSCGFVNFETLESAVRARSQLNSKEIFPGAGPVRIGYAKAPSASATPSGNGFYPSPSPDPFGHKQAEGSPSHNGTLNRQRAASGAPGSLESISFTLAEALPEIVSTVKEFGATEDDQSRIESYLQEALSFDDYQSDIPSVPEPAAVRMHDAPKLREIRKRIDNGACSPSEIESIAMNMLTEIAELSSDYLGNTVVQKLFEHCSEETKEQMLAQIAPHLAEIGVHKNGTWAAQKIIEVARTPQQMSMIVDSLRPYAVALFLDQYGNYVMQCCLKFPAGYNNFIFQAMLSRLWDVAQGRFGARAMRACLESHHATKDQQRMLAAAVALHSVQLATNANGALLLTWYLDTCNFLNRRKVLAPRLIPYLVQLCTHKVAYLTVLKIINQRNEPAARDSLLQALFFSPEDQVLEDILKDQNCGATLIFKVLTTPFLEEDIRPDVQESIRRVLLKIKAQPGQGYKRLMDEVGLSIRGQGPTARDSGDMQSHAPKQQNGVYVPAGGQPLGASTSMGVQQPPGFEQFDASQMSGAFVPNANVPSTASPMTPQSAMQFQQGMYAGGGRPQQGFGYAPAAMNDYASGQSPIDVYRNMAQAQQRQMPMSPGMPMMAQPGLHSRFQEYLAPLAVCPHHHSLLLAQKLHI
ncbi:hypothetical protein FH972_025979 [Carpinus fangiana]|uniref:PUM-HD domain-containing protein n=1 Tax=Carpinus fangiana TaxID=176857 RepID=A0A5N6L579_9ROSI|nr:hypothetical protein FH972_025979 [Carpinus fangiana]